MCGRLNVISDPLSQFLMDVLGVQYDGEDHYNLAPMSRVPILIQSEQKETEVLPMQWWLVPHWANTPSTKYSMFNARSETAARSPAFKEPYNKRRCLIPVSAYFEWTNIKGKKVPSMIRPKLDKGLFLAGLWDRWEKGSELIESFTVLTTEACEGLAQVHKRQPVMLNSKEALKINSVNYAGFVPWLIEIITEERIKYKGSLWVLSSVASDRGLSLIHI